MVVWTNPTPAGPIIAQAWLNDSPVDDVVFTQDRTTGTLTFESNVDGQFRIRIHYRQGATVSALSSDVEVETVILEPSGVWSGTIALGRSFVVSQLTTDCPARVRIYTDDASAVADEYRNIGVAPSGNHGLILEAVTTGERLSWIVSPGAIGFSDESLSSIVVTNLHSQSVTVVVTVRRLLLEV
jgi:hypothetical protein